VLSYVVRLPRNPRCRPWLAGVWLGWAVVSAAAQGALPFEAPVTAASVSGQFIIHGRNSSLPPTSNRLTAVGDEPVIELQPDILAVTCERVKAALHDRLGLRDTWRGKVHLHLQRTPAVEHPIGIRPQLYRDGWQYHLAVTDRVEWDRLVRALVEVVLLEQVNQRNTGGTCAQPPLWFTEGLHRLILAEHGRALVIEAQTTRNRSARKPDPLAPARAVLQGREPMTFSELGLVTLGQLAQGDTFPHFQASATLLVHQLTVDDEARRRAREFLAQLPAHLNWQTAFLRVHEDRFASLLDVEKWWALHATRELARDPALLWPADRVRAELADILSETARIRDQDGSARRVLSLGEVIETWDFATQTPVLQRKTSQLQVLALRAPAELQPLVAECFRTLHGYLEARTAAGSDPQHRGDLTVRTGLLAKTTARRLAQLERDLAAGK